MDEQKTILFFLEHFPEITETVLAMALWTDFKNETELKKIEDGLFYLAGTQGVKEAASLYCLLAAYGNHPTIFDKDKGAELIFATNSLMTYHKLLENTLLGIVEDNPYEYMYGFPITHAFKSLKDKTSN